MNAPFQAGYLNSQALLCRVQLELLIIHLILIRNDNFKVKFLYCKFLSVNTALNFSDLSSNNYLRIATECIAFKMRRLFLIKCYRLSSLGKIYPRISFSKVIILHHFSRPLIGSTPINRNFHNSV